MIFNIKHVANWEFIRQNKQDRIEKNNKAENAKRVHHTYKEGDLVLLRRGTENKYEAPYKGQFNILKVNDNGKVCLRIGAVEDTYNIRRLTPYNRANVLNHGGECSMQNSSRLKETKNNLTDNVQTVMSTCDAMSRMMSTVQLKTITRECA